MFKKFKKKEDAQSVLDEAPIPEPIKKTGKKVHKLFFIDFRKFLLRDSVLTLSIGIIVGNAFTHLINSFITDVFNPIVSKFLSINNLESKFINLPLGDYVATIRYGDLLSTAFNFLLTALAVFLLIKLLQMILLNEKERKIPSDKEIQMQILKQLKQSNKLQRQQKKMTEKLIAKLDGNADTDKNDDQLKKSQSKIQLFNRPKLQSPDARLRSTWE